jgi:LAO/AO transport system kinase
MKAGLMEVADAYLVNKADLPGLDRLVQQLNDILEMREIPAEQRPPILTAISTAGEGIADLAACITTQLAEREQDGRLGRRRQENFRRRVKRLVEGRLQHDVWEAAGLKECLARRTEQDGSLSAYGLADEILDSYRNGRPPESGS